jgi:histidyl-tRNA synthetase
LVHLKPNNDKLRSDTVFIATLGQEARKRGFYLLSNLRENHPHVRAIADFDSGSLKSQLRAAVKNGARWAVIIGDDELKKGKEGTGVFQLKDLSVERGIQEEYELHDAPNVLEKKIAENV